ILEKMGEGGMGVVYKAEQREPVRRIVALKVIKLGMDTREVVARFEAERQALALMNHPNVAKVFEAGMTDTGRPFFAMEHVPGVSLTQYCDNNKLTTRERLELFIPICHAVQHAHQKGIIHRDLKPSNLLVTLFDGKPVPKVIDFGIAKATNQQLTQQTLYTQTGSLIGTPEYMSPEQAQTSGLDVDTRTDVYSLGVIMYELLTGALPFDHETLHRAGPDGMAKMIREEEPDKPSTKLAVLHRTPTPKPNAPSADELARLRRSDWRTLQRELRGDLDWIVLKAMEKDRTHRYETASALAADIVRYLKDEPVLAGPPSTLYRIVKFARRNRGWFTAASAVAIALIVGFTVALVGFIRATKANSELNKEFVREQAALNIAQKERAEAQQQRAEADRQRVNAQLALAAGTLAQADALDLAGRWVDAGARYSDAYGAYQRLGRPTLDAELGLWAHYSAAPPPLLTFGSGGAFHSIALSRDGRLALTGSDDRGAPGLKLWDIQNGTELRSFAGHNGAVHCVALSADGRKALSGSEDKTLRLWDVQSGESIRIFPAQSGAVSCVAFSPDQTTAISGGEDGLLKVWNLDTGDLIRTFGGGNQNILSVAFSPDGTLVLSGGADKTLKLWNAKAGELLRTFTGHTSWISSVAFSPDGAKALSGSDDQTVRLWDVQSGSEIRAFRGHNRRVSSVAFSPDGKRALSASDDATVKLWNVDSGQEIQTLHGHTGHVLAAAFLADGQMALSGGDDKTLELWDLGPGSELRPLRGHSTYGSCLAFSSDGRLALSGSYDNSVKLWDVATGLELRTFTGHSGAVLSVAFSPDGHMAVSGSADQSIELWDVQSGSEIRPLNGHTGAIQAVAFSPDGRTIASGSADQTMKLWDVRTGAEIRTFAKATGVVTSVAFSPDGRAILCGGEDKTLRLFDAHTGDLLRTLSGHSGRVLGVALAPDGVHAVSASDDQTLMLWDLRSGAVIRTLAGHSAPILCVAFSADGATILSGGEDRTLKLWDAQSGNLLRSFDPEGGAILGLAASPDGYTTLTASYGNQQLRLWDFGRAGGYLRLIPQVQKAQETLQRDPRDAEAIATLGRWYAFRGIDAWAIELLTAARSAGAGVTPLSIGRCLWRAGRLSEAAREYHQALDAATDPQQRFYLELCLERLRPAQPGAER
ncbi:MAG TPA: protein kinase, partial [Tepidisphaeraceae bacterium]|nr:protein kinase [Tepidisphaeraceae bacterium]